MKPIVYDPKHPQRDWYEELCALAAIGELSSSEFEELQQHLSQCRECQIVYGEFRRISADDLGWLAVLRRSEQVTAEPGESFDEDALLTRVLDRASQTPALAGAAPAPAPVAAGRKMADRLLWVGLWLQRPALAYGAVALLLCAAATVAGFRVREAQLTPTLRDLSAQLSAWKGHTQNAEAERRSASEQLQQSRVQISVLQKLLAETQGKSTALVGERDRYQAQVDAYSAQLDQRNKDLETAKINDAEDKKKVAELEAKLQDAGQHAEQQDANIDRLRNQLWAEVSERMAAQNVSNAEAKELFGARDLHIVDVYDVGGNGQTRRTYGRVYYVAKKLLIFYAFDLQDKRRNRVAVGFQAWGYRQPNESTPENLGLFTLDDDTQNRWVLRVNNPRVLERIDAVFVTLENPHGSPTPRGRRILYANLAGPANHP